LQKRTKRDFNSLFAAKKIKKICEEKSWQKRENCRQRKEKKKRQNN